MPKYLDRLKKVGTAALAALAIGSTSFPNQGAIAGEPGKPEAKAQEKPEPLEERVNKFVFSKDALVSNPSLWNRILVYQDKGEELFCVPAKLLDGETSKDNPELKRIEIVQKGEDNFSLRRYYVLEKKGKEFYDEVKLNQNTVADFFDYLIKLEKEGNPLFKHVIGPGLGVDPQGPYARVRYRNNIDKETYAEIGIRINQLKGYNVEIEVNEKGEAIIVGSSKEEISKVGKVPKLDRTEWSVAKVQKGETDGSLARITVTNEDVLNKKLEGKKIGDWKAADDRVSVEYGQTGVAGQIGYLWVADYDGRGSGALFAITRGKSDSDEDKKSQNDVLVRQLVSKNQNAIPTGTHSVEEELKLGYMHGSPRLEFTKWLFGGGMGVTPWAYGMSTERNPVKEAGNPFSESKLKGMYGSVAVGLDLPIKLGEKLFAKNKEENKKPSMVRQALSGVSIRLNVPYESGKVYVMPEFTLNSLEVNKYDSRR